MMWERQTRANELHTARMGEARPVWCSCGKKCYNGHGLMVHRALMLKIRGRPCPSTPAFQDVAGEDHRWVSVATRLTVEEADLVNQVVAAHGFGSRDNFIRHCITQELVRMASEAS